MSMSQHTLEDSNDGSDTSSLGDAGESHHISIVFSWDSDDDFDYLNDLRETYYTSKVPAHISVVPHMKVSTGELSAIKDHLDTVIRGRNPIDFRFHKMKVRKPFSWDCVADPISRGELDEFAQAVCTELRLPLHQYAPHVTIFRGPRTYAVHSRVQAAATRRFKRNGVLRGTVSGLEVWLYDKKKYRGYPLMDFPFKA